jgi:hypothetical protein
MVAGCFDSTEACAAGEFQRQLLGDNDERVQSGERMSITPLWVLRRGI